MADLTVFHPEGPTFFELARQALSSTEHGYDLLAPKFEHTPFRTPDWMLEAVMKQIGGPGSLARALDVCCGTGAGMRHLRPLCREEVVGVDMSAGMLAQAETLVAQAPGDAKIRLVRGDAFAMPFDREFDVATCFGALGHILPKDEERFLAAVHRTLKPGGRFVFVTSTPPPVLSLRSILARGFNAAMVVRNLLWRPKFIMYYLTFLLPQVRAKLERVGFDVEERRGLFARPFQDFVVVLATRRA